MSNIMNKFNEILKEKDINIGNILNNSSTNSTSQNNTNNSENTMNIDIATLLKFKNIFDKINNKDNPRNKLLNSLKPFLQENKKEKLEQYSKIANIICIINLLNESKGDDIS